MNTTNDEQMRAALREKLEFLAQPVDGEGRDIGWWQTLAAMQQTEAKDCLSLLASQPVAGEPVAMPDLTDRQVVSACFSYRHDYGLMDSKARGNLEFQCREWWRAICKELEVPSKHPMVLRATAQTPAPVVQEAVIDTCDQGQRVAGSNPVAPTKFLLITWLYRRIACA